MKRYSVGFRVCKLSPDSRLINISLFRASNQSLSIEALILANFRPGLKFASLFIIDLYDNGIIFAHVF